MFFFIAARRIRVAIHSGSRSRHTRRFEEAASSDPDERQSGGEQPDVDEQPQPELGVGGLEAGHAGAAEPAEPGARRRRRPALRRQHQRRGRRLALPQVLYHHVTDSNTATGIVFSPSYSTDAPRSACRYNVIVVSVQV